MDSSNNGQQSEDYNDGPLSLIQAYLAAANASGQDDAQDPPGHEYPAPAAMAPMADMVPVQGDHTFEHPMGYQSHNPPAEVNQPSFHFDAATYNPSGHQYSLTTSALSAPAQFPYSTQPIVTEPAPSGEYDYLDPAFRPLAPTHHHPTFDSQYLTNAPHAGFPPTPQQTHPQQAYPEQAYPQQAYPQQAYSQQAYSQQAYPQQASPFAPAHHFPGPDYIMGPSQNTRSAAARQPANAGYQSASTGGQAQNTSALVPVANPAAIATAPVAPTASIPAVSAATGAHNAPTGNPRTYCHASGCTFRSATSGPVDAHVFANRDDDEHRAVYWFCTQNGCTWFRRVAPARGGKLRWDDLMDHFNKTHGIADLTVRRAERLVLIRRTNQARENVGLQSTGEPQ